MLELLILNNIKLLKCFFKWFSSWLIAYKGCHSNIQHPTVYSNMSTDGQMKTSAIKQTPGKTKSCVRSYLIENCTA